MALPGSQVQICKQAAHEAAVFGATQVVKRQAGRTHPEQLAAVAQWVCRRIHTVEQQTPQQRRQSAGQQLQQR
jgi:hypothetical protein